MSTLPITMQEVIEAKLMENDTKLEEVLQNIRSVLEEDPEDLEFDLYTPLCDTAVYYFIEEVEEFEDHEYWEESIDDEDDDEDDNCLTEDGLDFWQYCDTIGLRLKPIDCL